MRRYGIPLAAVLTAFLVGYLFGHEGLGSVDDGGAVVRAVARDTTVAPAPVDPPPAAPKETTQLSPPTDPLILPRVKSFDLSAYHGTLIRSAPERTKKITLTFDDGPSVNTEAILEILRRDRAAATFFFCGGRMVGREQVVLDTVRQGSEVANHTWSHVSLTGMDAADVEAQIALTQEEILRTTGVQNVFVRPRGGIFDEVAMDVVRKMGLVMVGWDAYGHDTFNDGKSVAEIESFAVEQTRGGSIILLHEANPATVQALPAILRRLREQGYEIVTLSDLLSAR